MLLNATAGTDENDLKHQQREILKHNQVVAAEAYRLYTVNKKAGLNYFKNNIQGTYGSSRNRLKLMRRSALAQQNAGKVSKRRGRRQKVTDEQVYICMRAFLDGFEIVDANGALHLRWFTSIQDAATSGNAPAINQVLRATGISVDRLWRRMVKLWRGILDCRKRVDIKCALTAAVKKNRLETATKLLNSFTIEDLLRAVWSDGKKLHVTAPTLYVYMDCPECVEESDLLPQGKFGIGVVLYYYAAVSAIGGTIFFKWVTGTTELVTNYQVWVSSHQLLHCKASMCMQ